MLSMIGVQINVNIIMLINTKHVWKDLSVNRDWRYGILVVTVTLIELHDFSVKPKIGAKFQKKLK